MKSRYLTHSLVLLRFWILRMLPWWCFLGFIIFIMQIVVAGFIFDNERISMLLKFIDMLPPFVKSALGGDLLSANNLPALIAIGYNHPLVLTMFMLYAVGTPTAMLAGESQRGTMELILSRSVTKGQVYTCAAVVTVMGMVSLCFVMFMGTIAATNVFEFKDPVPLFNFFRLAVNGGLLAGAAGAFALLSAGAFHQRNRAIGAAAGFIIVNYFISIFSEAWKSMEFLKPWTMFYYVKQGEIFAQNVWPLKAMGVLLALCILAVTAGAVIWQRRDLKL